ncbi:GNAT family N-acetyltransferase [Nocardia jiangxiensis]|uniref:GNAT family N-acetyltransferase n=2 Tax=Nocardia jiangxiensis TaxID=282685 RepID=A0ABW6S1F1_9NOCA
MTIRVRRSGPDDRAAILRLMAAARGDGLSPDERAERGFVQGTMDEAVLARFEAGTGVFLAEEGDRLAGFAMTSGAVDPPDGPPRRTLEAARAAVGDQRIFLYGPAAVDPSFQGRGVLSLLLRELGAQLRDRFDLGVAFVEDANRKSLAVHRHYGMTEVPGFSVGERRYHVFTFEPAQFALPEAK